MLQNRRRLCLNKRSIKRNPRMLKMKAPSTQFHKYIQISNLSHQLWAQVRITTRQLTRTMLSKIMEIRSNKENNLMCQTPLILNVKTILQHSPCITQGMWSSPTHNLISCPLSRNGKFHQSRGYDQMQLKQSRDSDMHIRWSGTTSTCSIIIYFLYHVN